MKNILKLLLVMLLFVTKIEAQEGQTPYKTLQSFNNDTLAYLEYNYTTRSIQYKNKAVGEVLNECELPVIIITDGGIRTDVMVDIPIRGGKPDITSEVDTKSKFVGISLGFTQSRPKPSELKDYYITIYFENPPIADEYDKIKDKQDGHKWTLEVYNYIKDIKIGSITSNPYLYKKRTEESKKDELPQSDSKPKERKSIDDAIKTITPEQLKNAELMQVPSTVPPLKKTP